MIIWEQVFYYSNLNLELFCISKLQMRDIVIQTGQGKAIYKPCRSMNHLFLCHDKITGSEKSGKHLWVSTYYLKLYSREWEYQEFVSGTWPYCLIYNPFDLVSRARFEYIPESECWTWICIWLQFHLWFLNNELDLLSFLRDIVRTFLLKESE